MAYTNETTHYGLPLPTGSDLTVPMDYNESFEEIDTVIFEAQTNASGAVGTAGNALDVANAASTAAAEATSAAAGATATAQAAATAANEAVAAVAEAKDDALDMICAVVEETATAQYKHEPTKGGLNYYFRYNDILYKTTAVINVGETIVPNTNCAATNVATELEAGAAAGTASDVSYSNATSGLTATNVQSAIDELAGKMEADTVTAETAETLTLNTPYTTPSDGYLVLEGGSSALIAVYLKDSSSATIGHYLAQGLSSASGASLIAFVKKGMTLELYSDTGATKKDFVPISYS